MAIHRPFHLSLLDFPASRNCSKPGSVAPSPYLTARPPNLRIFTAVMMGLRIPSFWWPPGYISGAQQPEEGAFNDCGSPGFSFPSIVVLHLGQVSPSACDLSSNSTATVMVCLLPIAHCPTPTIPNRSQPNGKWRAEWAWAGEAWEELYQTDHQSTERRVVDESKNCAAPVSSQGGIHLIVHYGLEVLPVRQVCLALWVSGKARKFWDGVLANRTGHRVGVHRNKKGRSEGTRHQGAEWNSREAASQPALAAGSTRTAGKGPARKI
ncbi:hypothetical protein B0T22DRAFT_122352 [Podospora appendiculata]|uniref:Uncharacterized protein n=1 Tax=Podospora appendiculata TaxID=314037 RepID=A0AAE0X729_9PEZI|nr:hypothetical protein B0T22DRAFT_122352 [Podospora appendiculata]